MNYLITDDKHWLDGLVKWGSSKDPWIRSKQLQTGNSMNEWVLCSWNGLDPVLKQSDDYHAYRRFRGNREWFPYTEELVAYLSSRVLPPPLSKIQRSSMLDRAEVVKSLGVPSMGEIPEQPVQAAIPVKSPGIFTPEPLPKSNTRSESICRTMLRR